LSLSLSPAFGPWGIPEEPDDEPAGVDVVAGVDFAAGGVDDDPPVVEELELPQPATARVTKRSAQLA
jgi:hypothetical protein